jgi:hypothetical protein
MKITCLLLLTIINAQLAHGALYAAPPDPAQNQSASDSAPEAASAQANRPTGASAPQSETRASGETHQPPCYKESPQQQDGSDQLNSSRAGWWTSGPSGGKSRERSFCGSGPIQSCCKSQFTGERSNLPGAPSSAGRCNSARVAFGRHCAPSRSERGSYRRSRKLQHPKHGSNQRNANEPQRSKELILCDTFTNFAPHI